MIGSFYLRLTDSGNLIGEYTNTESTRIYTESAERISEITLEKIQSFNGTFETSWRENNVPFLANLVIEPIEDSNDLKYRLDWTITNDHEIRFTGEGFLVDGILVGHYTVS